MNSNKKQQYIIRSVGATALLLSASVAQADISGKVFRDFNANGVFDTSANFKEVGAAGITVKAFDASGAPAASTTSAADGSYTLTGLSSGAEDVGYKKTVACAKPFDPMTGNHFLETNTAKPVVSSTLDDAAILGGERDMKLEKLQSDANYSSAFYVGDDGQGNGIIDFNNGPGDFSKATIVWDGDDNDANTLNPNGLGGVDLSSGDAFGMMVDFVDIERFKATLRIYSGAANVSEAIFAYDNSKDGTSSNIPVTLTFAAVSGSGADLTKMGAVELVIEPIDLEPTAGGIDLMIGKFTAPCPVVPTAVVTDLKLEKSVAPTTAKRGETVVYTLTVTNESDVDATGVAVNDKLPAGVTYVAHAPTTASYDKASGDWNVGSVPAKTTATLTINVSVD